MTRSRLLISGAWLLQGAAWFLPVVTSIAGGRIDPLGGLGAFLAASSAVWPGATFLGTWYDAVLATLSVATTIGFVIGSPWVVLRGTRSLRRASAGVAAVAFLVNAHWYVLLTPNSWVSGLGIGYFLWWWSFLLLATGLFDLAGQHQAAESTYNQTALLPR